MNHDLEPSGYNDLVTNITGLLEVARQQASRAVNSVLVVTYWQIGRRIVEQEQHGADRADYGEQLLERLGRDLSAQFGRGFSAVNLRRMRSFYSEFSDSSLILSTLSTEFETPFPELERTRQALLTLKLEDAVFVDSSDSAIVQQPAGRIPFVQFRRQCLPNLNP